MLWGGDYAPQAIVEGVNQALADFSDIEINSTEMNLNQAISDSDRARQHYPYG